MLPADFISHSPAGQPVCKLAVHTTLLRLVKCKTKSNVYYLMSVLLLCRCSVSYLVGRAFQFGREISRTYEKLHPFFGACCLFTRQFWTSPVK